MPLIKVFDTVQNRNTGIPIPGVTVRLRYAGTTQRAPIYIDQGGGAFPTPDETVTDQDGMYSFFADTADKYDFDFFVGPTLYKTIGDVTIAAGSGSSGPANSTYQTTADLKAALVSNVSGILAETGKAGTFTIRNYADFTAEVAADAGEINYIRSTSDASKVWVRTTILESGAAQVGTASGSTVQSELDTKVGVDALLPPHAPWPFTATAGQTAFVASQSVGFSIKVVVNDQELTLAEDYTRFGDTVTLLRPASAGDAVLISAVQEIPTISTSATSVGAQDSDGQPSTVQVELGRRAQDDLSNVTGFIGAVSNFEGSGYSAIRHSVSFVWIIDEAGPVDARDRFFLRRADYTGGDGGSAEQGGAGFVNANTHVQTDVGINARANEWVILGILENYAPGFSGGGLAIPQNAAGYFLGRKRLRVDGQATSPTIVGVTELEDFTTNPTTSSVTHEFDLSVKGPNNTDDNNNRVLLHLVPRSITGSGTGNEIGRGIFCTPTTGLHLKTMFEVELSGGTIGNYFDFPQFYLTSAGDLTAHQLRVERSSADAVTNARHGIIVDGVEYARTYVDNSSNVVFDNGGVVGFRINPTAGALEPLRDNIDKLGGAAKRFAEAFIGNPTINTSDARLKTPLRAFGDDELDAVGSVAAGAYQWLDAVAEKGEAGARLHAGVIAQQLRDAFAARGLDAAHYALWCADPVTEIVMEEQIVTEPETVVVEGQRVEHRFEDGRAVRVVVPTQETRPAPPDMFPEDDEAGNPIILPASPARTERRLKNGATRGSKNPADYEDVVVREALPERPSLVARPRMIDVPRMVPVEQPVIDPATGQPLMRLGLRYAELLMMMQAWTRRELARLAARVEALEESA